MTKLDRIGGKPQVDFADVARLGHAADRVAPVDQGLALFAAHLDALPTLDVGAG